MKRILPAILGAAFGLGAASAHALDAGAESVENYSGCGCNSGNLSYTNDQTSMFMSRIGNWHNRKFRYTDSSAWNSDMVEDELAGGTDYPYGDTVHILFLSGHGGLSGNTYNGYLCKSSNFSGCNYNTGSVYLGERSGQAKSTHPGSLRFLLLATCYSVEKTNAADVWGPVFWRGKNFMYVMGYTGTSADSTTTDEVGEDFAQKAAGDKWTLKQAWFWAIEDWWVNDTGSLISHGTSSSNATYNRDQMKIDATPTGNSPSWVAWAWHEG